ncbi:serine hydrolase domain-containing protein [Aquimarina spinulae]|uniref:serine hydrolase domain-containing protein n=1 Tax=Aquimarina spinulae TaxID=1192023 RepID=UPI000D55C0C7|nr:serine hydrolase [Aquimarina spinulae]
MKSKLSLLFIFFMLLVACKESKKNTPKNEKPLSKEIVLDENDIYSVLVSKNNQIVFEEYYNGKTSENVSNVQSLTKGIMSILIGIAIDKKFITSENETIDTYFADEFKDIEDERKKTITIKHLLNQTSGLSWKGFLEHQNWINSENPIAFVLQKKLEHTPGETYNYNTGATHLLSAILNKSTGKTTLEFANENLFNALAINTVNWEKRNDGHYDGGGLGLEMKPGDLLKIGQLLEHKGTYNGVEIVSKSWVEKLFDVNEKLATDWGLRNSKHGFCWYHANLNEDRINYGMGYGGQFIIMIADKNLVIVTTHNHDTPNGIKQQIKFLNGKLPLLIEKYGN